jgi:hypothetical protein
METTSVGGGYHVLSRSSTIPYISKLEESVIIRWVLEGRETFRIEHSSPTYSNDK